MWHSQFMKFNFLVRNYISIDKIDVLRPVALSTCTKWFQRKLNLNWVQNGAVVVQQSYLQAVTNGLTDYGHTLGRFSLTKCLSAARSICHSLGSQDVLSRFSLISGQSQSPHRSFIRILLYSNYSPFSILSSSVVSHFTFLFNLLHMSPEV